MRGFCIAILVAVFALSSVSSPAAFGQSVGGEGTIRKTTGDPTPRSKAIIRIVPKTVIKEVTPTTGSLSVAADSTATILVEPLDVKKGQRGQGQQGVVPASERIFIFNGLKPGRYRVAGTLTEHSPVESTVVIAANKSQSLTLNFERILYTVTVTTNVDSGELR